MGLAISPPGLMIFASGLTVVAFGYRLRRESENKRKRHEAIKMWPTCVGRVLKSQITRIENKKMTRFEFVCRYVYNGAPVERVDVITVSDRMRERIAKYEAIVLKYPEGSPMTVYMSPDSKGYSEVEATMDEPTMDEPMKGDIGSNTTMAIGLVIAAAGLCL